MLSKEELQKMSESSYGVWFERYYKNEKIESQIKESAQKGYKGITIDCMVEARDSGYLRQRMRDDRFVESLREKLPELKVNRNSGYSNHQLFSVTVKREYDTVSISWS